MGWLSGYGAFRWAARTGPWLAWQLRDVFTALISTSEIQVSNSGASTSRPGELEQFSLKVTHPGPKDLTCIHSGDFFIAATRGPEANTLWAGCKGNQPIKQSARWPSPISEFNLAYLKRPMDHIHLREYETSPPTHIHTVLKYSWTRPAAPGCSAVLYYGTQCMSRGNNWNYPVGCG